MKKRPYKYDKLKGRIKEKCGTQECFAALMGMNRSTLSLKLNNDSEFSQGEILKACTILCISAEKIPAYFFNEKV